MKDVSLCQYQIPPSSFLSPFHTTSTPAGARQTVLLVTSVPEVRLASVFLPDPHPLNRVLQLSRRRP